MSGRQFTDVNSCLFVCAGPGLSPLRVSCLILQLQTLRMDLIRTTVTTTTKRRAKPGLSRLRVGALCTKSKRFFHLSLIWNLTLGEFRSIHKKDYILDKKPTCTNVQKITGSRISRLRQKTYFSLLRPAICRRHLFLQSPPGSFHWAPSVTEAALLTRDCCLLMEC